MLTQGEAASRRLKKTSRNFASSRLCVGQELKIIGIARNPYKSKFGVPRQSLLVQEVETQIVMQGEYANPDAFRGIEQFTHLWILWLFHEVTDTETFHPTVRPPRLGGNTRIGVFATRSPFRPNRIGLTCVKLERVEIDAQNRVVLTVQGADFQDGTPILDIKPYITYADAHPEAVSGFASQRAFETLNVEIPTELKKTLSEAQERALRAILSNDPRPQYHNDPHRSYGFTFGDYEVHFHVEGNLAIVETIEQNFA